MLRLPNTYAQNDIFTSSASVLLSVMINRTQVQISTLEKSLLGTSNLNAANCTLQQQLTFLKDQKVQIERLFKIVDQIRLVDQEQMPKLLEAPIDAIHCEHCHHIPCLCHALQDL